MQASVNKTSVKLWEHDKKKTETRLMRIYCIYTVQCFQRWGIIYVHGNMGARQMCKDSIRLVTFRNKTYTDRWKQHRSGEK
jgi:hypothetical protein